MDDLHRQNPTQNDHQENVSPNHGATILIVDDDETFRYAAAKALITEGFQVLCAADYRDALDYLNDNRPIDLLITDIMMPDRINGFALARMARMVRVGLRTIYVTGYDVPASEAVGPLLRKPINPDTIVLSVRSALKGPAPFQDKRASAN